MFVWSQTDKKVLPIAFLIIVVVAIIYHFLTKNKSNNLKKLPLRFLAIAVVALEISKQIYYHKLGTFTTYILPLHFCSLFIVLFPLAQFLPNRIAKYIKPLPFCYSILVFILLLVHPHALIGNSSGYFTKNFPSFHTFFYHHCVVAYFIFSIAVNDYKPKYKDCLNLIIGIIIYVSYALPIAYKLKVNYVNILYSFFAPFEKFRLQYGQIIYNITLFFVGITSVCLICIIYTFIYNLIGKMHRKRA